MVDIFQTDKEITVLADMPGVKETDLRVELINDVLTLIGDMPAPEPRTEGT